MTKKEFLSGTKFMFRPVYNGLTVEEATIRDMFKNDVYYFDGRNIKDANDNYYCNVLNVYCNCVEVQTNFFSAPIIHVLLLKWCKKI